MFDGLKSNGGKWDIIGLSVYPFWANLPWAVDDSLALITMQEMITRYNTKVIVVEAGHPYNKPVEANQYLLDLIAKTKSAGGLGVFYWEPQCYSWQGYQMGAWDPVTKQPTVAMDAFLGISATSVNEDENIPVYYDLNIYPNPFNPNTTIEYKLSNPSNTTVVIYDILGREMSRLVDDFKNAGKYSIDWDGTGLNGDILPSGTYLIRLNTGSETKSIKAILLR
jgi:hypothetical protein